MKKAASINRERNRENSLRCHLTLTRKFQLSETSVFDVNTMRQHDAQ